MADNSSIEWTDSTWSPVVGCRKVSAGCDHCYAIRDAHRMAGNPNEKISSVYAGLTQIQNGRPNWTGIFRELPERLFLPLSWKKPRRIFVNSMSDLFGEGVSDGFIAQVWDVMGRASWHQYQILTKRPERMRDWVTRWADLSGETFDWRLVRGPEATRAAHPSGRGQLFAAMLESMGDPPPGCAYPTFDWAEGQRYWPRVLPNVWLGVSCEDQRTADERIPLLLQTPAEVRFLSLEPLLGPVELHYVQPRRGVRINALTGAGLNENGACQSIPNLQTGHVSWVIAGAESGPGARPMNEDWVRAIRDACEEDEVAFFYKQSANANGRKIHTPELDGRRWMDYPA